MKALLVIPFIAIAAAGCNAQAQADATAVAEYICTSAQTMQASGLVLNQAQTTSLNSIVNACNVTAGGSNLTQATAVAAIFAGLVTLQQGGLLNGIKMKALANDQVLALRKLPIDQGKLDWFLAHDQR